MKFLNTRGQGAVNAAVLVALIAGLIILYILFLPAEEQERFLENKTKAEREAEDEEKILLDEGPLHLEFLSKQDNDHYIDPVNLYTRVEANILKQVNTISARSAWFDKQTGNFTFRVGELELTDQVLLSFNAPVREGRLLIRLNGVEVYNKELTSVTVPPIKLPKDALAIDNTLTFSVSGVGFQFWSTNEYTLENIKVTADITDTTTQASRNIFFLTDSEYNALDKTTLRFNSECEPTQVGVMDVIINNKNIHSAIPDCGSVTRVEFSPFYLASGENVLIFRSDRGRYIIDQINVKTELKESPSYLNFFEVSNEQFKDVQNDRADVNLTFTFVDGIEEKEAEIIINGRRTYLPRTEDLAYEKNINIYLEEGSNSIKIVPKITMDIRNLKIEFVEK